MNLSPFIQRFRERFAEVEAQLSAPDAFAQPQRGQELTREHARLRDLVSATPTDSELSPELLCLAQAVYFEARGEELRGQLAVARVVINRATSGQFPDDYCSVVRQRGQFSFVRGGQIPAPDASSTAWRNAVAIARIAHQDLWVSAAGDALYFHAARVHPQWASNRGAVTRIDSHIFYR